jgi:hypothetical protein
MQRRRMRRRPISPPPRCTRRPRTLAAAVGMWAVEDISVAAAPAISVVAAILVEVVVDTVVAAAVTAIDKYQSPRVI